MRHFPAIRIWGFPGFYAGKQVNTNHQGRTTGCNDGVFSVNQRALSRVPKRDLRFVFFFYVNPPPEITCKPVEAHHMAAGPDGHDETVSNGRNGARHSMVSFNVYLISAPPLLFTGDEGKTSQIIGTFLFIVIQQINQSFKDGSPGMALPQRNRPKDSGNAPEFFFQGYRGFGNVVEISTPEPGPGFI